VNTRPKTGVLLVNLGTPDGPDVPAVRRYLAEFLDDPRVIDINPVARWLLLRLFILPFRPAKSAEAYQKIWTERGSPLLFHGQDLAQRVRERMTSLEIELAMRYGNPSIRAGLTALKDRGCDGLVIFPLYPHYAASSTGSTIEKVYEEVKGLWNTPYLTMMPPFFDHAEFIGAFGEIGRSVIGDFSPDHILFSFHGLPERHMKKSDETGGRHCLTSASCCDAIVPANRNCYRAQCFATARALEVELNLPAGGYSVAFQSRLGRDPWIKPYTDEVLMELPKRGVKRLAVFCPAFVADCLETIEEIGIRARESFIESGGQDLRLVPSLNASPVWADAVAKMLRTHLPTVG
jgi:ferrochelatase